MVLILVSVVDHFGDAGVALRLARGLLAQGQEVTIAIDQPGLLAVMQPDPLFGLEVVRMPTTTEAADDLLARTGPVVMAIEAFQIDVPAPLRQRLYAQIPRPERWMLDYLSTEPWSDGLQGLESPDPSTPGWSRRWFAPSFSSHGPGLVHHWEDAEPAARLAMRRRLLAEAGMGKAAARASEAELESALLVMAFGYHDAPWARLLQAIREHGLPAGKTAAYIWQPQGLVMSQAEFDLALAACDLNFVRGEDSFVAAHAAAASPWAPLFVWQPYRQDDEAHRHKLGGWCDQALLDPSLAPLDALHWAFNRLARQDNEAPPTVARAWAQLCEAWGPAREALQHRCQQLLARPGIANRIESCLRGQLPPLS